MFTDAFILALLNGLKASGKPLNAATLVLYKNDTGPQAGMVPGDFVPADFVGYSDTTAIAFGGAYRVTARQFRLSAPSIEFLAGTAPGTQTIYGWALMNAAKDTVHHAKRLATPVTISVAGDGFMLPVDVDYGQ